MLDKKDLEILSILQEDARLSNKELAAKVHLSPTPVYERVRRMEREGYIKKYMAVMDAEKGLEAFRQADEAGSERAVLEYLADLVKRGEVVGIKPDSLPHEEGIVAAALAALYFKALEELAEHEVDDPVQILEEAFDVPPVLQAQAGEVDGRERQVPAAERGLAALVIPVRHDAGAAAHVRHFMVGIVPLQILPVERRIHEGEVREEALRGNAAGQLEEVVVRILGIEAVALADLEDMDGEYGGLAVAKAGILREEGVPDDHAAFGRGVGSVVDGAEGHLRAGTAVHGVQVVNKSFHGLIGVFVGLCDSFCYNVVGFLRRKGGSQLLADIFKAFLSKDGAEGGIFAGRECKAAERRLHTEAEGFIGITHIKCQVDVLDEAACDARG